MECIRIVTIIVLIDRIVTRSVVFNYNSNIDSIQEDIHTFMEDTEDMDTGVRLFLEGFKQNIANEELLKRKIVAEGNIDRNMEIFKILQGLRVAQAAMNERWPSKIIFFS